MTLPAYPGRHATFDATTVLPVVPPAGAPPGRPTVVEAAFWTMVAPAALGVLGSLAVAGFTLIWALGYSALELYLTAAVILVLGVGANVAWFLLGLRMRTGSTTARVGYAALTALGALVTAVVCVPLWMTLVPLVVLGCQVTVLVLLFLPETNAWFRAVDPISPVGPISPVPGPGSPRR
ncbi:hypothetical protein [Actinomycetospora chiangmaiensis]|uniref:hypothetical protein n=1 Tax=Actinomycetospora chiangmaiensis TaxID=402650 RepID=UPI0003A1BBFE|nr:hypothetical protein [Actinomycetospora chiangmaiensis]